MIINPKVGFRQIGEIVAAYNCDDHMVALWSIAAGEVWKDLQNGISPEAIAHRHFSRWGMSEAEALEDVRAFIGELTNDGFIKSAGGDGAKEGGDETAGEAAMLQLEMTAIESLVPYAVTHEITWRCNERCVHCFMEKDKQELDTESIVTILGQLAEAGTLFLSFTGGEVFVRPDFLEIVDQANKMGFVLDILSNGTMIDQKIAEYLAKRKVRRVQLSIYGADATVHDAITQLPGSFETTMAALHLLTGTGVKVEIAFPMMSLNFEQRYQMKKLADDFDCVITPSPIITARNNGRTDTYDLRISDQQFLEFYQDRELSALYNGRKPFAEHQLYFGFTDLCDAAPCYSGFNTCAVSPDGIVYPCNQFLYPVGNLREQTFREIWRGEKLQQLRALRIRDLPECRQCELLHSCSRCPGLALLEGEGMLGKSPENCRQARIHQLAEGG